jgi:hypothetical protein
MIIISARFRGPELKGSRIDNAIATAMTAMARVREPDFAGSLGKIPHVNIVFVVEGSLGSPSDDAIRCGPYSRKSKCLQVDVAVSTADTSASDLREVIVRGLHGANAVAFHFFEDEGLRFPLQRAEEFVVAVSGELSNFT